MPQTYELLRKKFMVEISDGFMDDGIDRAERILLDSGWGINNGTMYPPLVDHVDKYTIGEQFDAETYLLEEWDYATSTSGFFLG